MFLKSLVLFVLSAKCPCQWNLANPSSPCINNADDNTWSYWCTLHQQIGAFTLKRVSEYADFAGIHNQRAASSEARAQS